MKILVLLTPLFFASTVLAGHDEPVASVATPDGAIAVPVNAISMKDVNERLGEVIISQSKYGLVFTPSLKGLEPGVHGFHIHQNSKLSACGKKGKAVAGSSAGRHYDPRLTFKDVSGRALMLKAGGDIIIISRQNSSSSSAAALAWRME